jgi:hypothetical protein
MPVGVPIFSSRFFLKIKRKLMNRNEVEIDAKVRLINDYSLHGIIVATTSRKNKEDVIVEWQNGDCSSVSLVDLELVPQRDSKLEAEFEALISSIGEEIQAKVKEAEKLLTEACALAEQYGIPFFTNASLLGQPYVPKTFEIKWHNLDRDFVTNMTEVPIDDLGSTCGWTSSQIC